MTDQFEIPESVINEWRQQCTCCAICHDTPCDGVMAGDICDDACSCDDEYYLDDEGDEGDNNNEY
ncbi:hypothetical protein SAMN03080615_01616 [Amphritea atlantica]|uniref:Uncharacterized protein n=1 Tax=Amphritea atlantica TaxID=355243 RepID=A0A1H9GD82_9GAMM|nr:hypothetical protein SAMN03080615_01616 [Amphritea atlantica]